MSSKASPLDMRDQQNISQMCQLLQHTLSADAQQRKTAENALASLEEREHFAMILLMITADANADVTLRQSASIAFKNFLSKKYHEEGGVSDSDRTEIKKNIVNVMIAVPIHIQKQISEAIMIICENDFPDQWPALLEELSQKLAHNDFNVIKGILFTAHALTKKYRDIFESEEVILEMQLVIKKLAPPLLTVFTNLLNFVLADSSRNAENKQQVIVAFECINLILHIYFSLNWLDLPEFFEDNMNKFMPGFLSITSYSNKLIENEEDDTDPSVLLLSKSLVCRIINLYMEKYEEEFEPYVQGFAMAIWNLLLATGNQLVFDTFVSNAIQFLTTVSRGVKHGLFGQQQTLNDICYKIVVPNVALRDDDEEMFEDDPVEYIRRDIEGSDNDTRRRSAVELVKALCEHYEAQVTALIQSRIVELLQQHAANPQTNWKAKDAAFYLFIAISTRAKTARGGATQVRDKGKIQQFLREQVAPELNQRETTDQYPILKADSIKFITTFRSQFEKQDLLQMIPLLVHYLESKHRVVHSYAAWALERIMALKDSKRQLIFTADDLKPLAERLLSALFSLTNTEASKENEYVMRAIMRLTTVLKEHMAPVMNVYIRSLTQILARVCKNPTNPTFNHYIFESYATVIKYNPGSVQAFEQALTPPFTSILQENVEEFIPYVLQIFTLLLDTRQPPIAPDSVYISVLLPKLIDQSMWQNQGNIPGLVGLINSMDKKAVDVMSQSDNLDHVLRIFQRLINSRRLDHHGFSILSGVVENLPLEKYAQHLPTIFIILFTRLQKSKTPKFVRGFVLFLSLFVTKFGADALFETMEKVSQGVFVGLAPVWAKGIHGVREGRVDRRRVSITAVKVLTECKAVVSAVTEGNEQMISVWGTFLLELIRFLEEEKKSKVQSDKKRQAMLVNEFGEEVDEDEAEEVAFQSRAYKVEFSKLSFASRKEDDPTSQYPDHIEQYAVQMMAQAVKVERRLQPVLRNVLSQNQSERNAFISWMLQVGIDPQSVM